ncbi:hypothetical protein CASFOL_014368 [Castilleja foliolosa]|uniref:Uncharacterized protein n=1 Tax=Castilleja foliolosa TaxID=1961234 RepID=A0ABD3DMP2_9LAMI
MKESTLDVSNADEPTPQAKRVEAPDMVVVLNKQDKVDNGKLIESFDLDYSKVVVVSPESKRAEDESVNTIYKLVGQVVIDFGERLNACAIYFLSYTLRTR